VSTRWTSCRRSRSRWSWSDHDVGKVLKIIADTAKTGQVGDGKIFVTRLENAVRIRTGEIGDGEI